MKVFNPAVEGISPFLLPLYSFSQTHIHAHMVYPRKVKQLLIAKVVSASADYDESIFDLGYLEKLSVSQLYLASITCVCASIT